MWWSIDCNLLVRPGIIKKCSLIWGWNQIHRSSRQTKKASRSLPQYIIWPICNELCKKLMRKSIFNWHSIYLAALQNNATMWWSNNFIWIIKLTPGNRLCINAHVLRMKRFARGNHKINGLYFKSKTLVLLQILFKVNMLFSLEHFLFHHHFPWTQKQGLK